MAEKHRLAPDTPHSNALLFLSKAHFKRYKAPMYWLNTMLLASGQTLWQENTGRQTGTPSTPIHRRTIGKFTATASNVRSQRLHGAQNVVDLCSVAACKPCG